MSSKTNLEEILKGLNRIVEGCGDVKTDPHTHFEAKSLATLVRKDCFKLINIIEEALKNKESSL